MVQKNWTKINYYINKSLRNRSLRNCFAHYGLVQLKQETKIEKKRIYDRILERCIPVKNDGVSRREAMANDNMQTMKNILKI